MEKIFRSATDTYQKSGRLSPVYPGPGRCYKKEEEYIERMLARDKALLGVETSPKFGHVK